MRHADSHRCSGHLLLRNMFMAPGGTASGISHGGVGLRSSCQDSCTKEGCVRTFVEVCDVSLRGILPGRRIMAPTFLTVPCGTFATRLVSSLTSFSDDAAREDRIFLRPSARYDPEVCGESARFCQARGHHQPASGRWVRSARLCTPRPSRRSAKRTMEQWALALLSTFAFCLHMF